jgi:hypothetical protein
MNDFWELTEIERDDAERAARLRASPPWDDLVRQMTWALRVALQAGEARFGFDEAETAAEDLRAVVQFPIGQQLFDLFFNGPAGYRAQFRIGQHNGLNQSALLISRLSRELELFAPRTLTARRFGRDLADKGSMTCHIGQVVASMAPQLSKVWICERLILKEGGTQDLFVSRTGPKLTFQHSESWSSLYPEESPGWLDLKGAFTGPQGAYQVKLPLERAAKLEARGTA